MSVGPDVLRVEPRADDVRAACLCALEDDAFRALVREAPSLYGDGHSAERIVEHLLALNLDPQMLLKTMTY